MERRRRPERPESNTDRAERVEDPYPVARPMGAIAHRLDTLPSTRAGGGLPRATLRFLCRLGANNYWSATENNATNAWYVNFNNGNTNNNNKTNNNNNVRCVRDRSTHECGARRVTAGLLKRKGRGSK